VNALKRRELEGSCHAKNTFPAIAAFWDKHVTV